MLVKLLSMVKLSWYILNLLAFFFAGSTPEKKSDIFIRINQVGYLTTESKEAVIFSNAAITERFLLTNKKDHTTIERLKPQRIRENGWGRFEYYYRLDFTHITTPGTYALMGEKSHTRSQDFQINTDVYRGTTGVLLEFMRQQRCGYNPYLDITCHQKDGRLMYGTLPDSTFLDVSGGWHDAGDQLKYLITGSYATAHMLKAYELYESCFDDRVNSLGQSKSNQLPDVLDEAKWGLDWIIKLHPNEYQLVHQIADDRDHIGWKMPDYDPSDYGWGKNSYRVAYVATGQPQGLREYKSEANGMANVAGRSAAALALGARIWKENSFDTAFALQCLKYARSLFDLGKKNEGYQQGNSYGAPYRYMEETWADDMEWAAAELFKTTKDPQYLTESIKYARMAGNISWMNRDSAAHYQFYPFVNMGHYTLYELVGKEFQDSLAQYYRNGIDYCLKRSETNAFSIGIPFIWCSNNLLTSLITQIILYERMTGDMQYHHFLVAQRDWLLGRNPWGTSMFTGLPDQGEYPLDVHTSIWALTKQEVPGGLVDGPVYASIYKALKGLSLLEEDEFSHLQNNYVVYHDDIGDYSTNEPTMDGTAGSMIMMAYWSMVNF